MMKNKNRFNDYEFMFFLKSTRKKEEKIEKEILELFNLNEKEVIDNGVYKQ